MRYINLHLHYITLHYNDHCSKPCHFVNAMLQTPANSVWLNPGDTTPETYNLYPASLCKASEALSIRESFVKFKRLHGVAAHLHHIKSAKFDPATFLWVIHLGALDDDGMCRKVDAPRQRRRRHQHLNVSVGKQVLHQRPVNPAYNDITHTSQQTHHTYNHQHVFSMYTTRHDDDDFHRHMLPCSQHNQTRPCFT